MAKHWASSTLIFNVTNKHTYVHITFNLVVTVVVVVAAAVVVVVVFFTKYINPFVEA